MFFEKQANIALEKERNYFMKKVMIALSFAMVIFASNMWMPATVYAKEESGCKEHMLNLVYERSYSTPVSSHPILLYNGPDGPVYDTCHVRNHYKDTHPKCSVCGYVDLDYRLTHELMSVEHDNVACPLH